MSELPRVSDPRSQVVITRFECPSLFKLILIFALHWRIKKEIRHVAVAYLGGTTLIQWRRRTLLSFSLWDKLDGIYSMGEAQGHIVASRIPARLGVATSCGIYTYRGDWRQIMFGTPTTAAEPVYATGTKPRIKQGDIR